MDTEKQQNTQLQPKRIEERDAFVGRWIKIKYIDLEIRGKKILNYEMYEKATDQHIKYDGVCAFPIIKKKEGDSQLVVIANFRPPVNKFVLELPGGMMDCQDPFKNAVRELKEETGYTASSQINLCKQEVPPIYQDPYLSCGSNVSVFLEIDENLPENQNLKQDLDEGEQIYAYLLPLNGDIMDSLTSLAKENNYEICLSLWNFASGISFSNKYLK